MPPTKDNDTPEEATVEGAVFNEQPGPGVVENGINADQPSVELNPAPVSKADQSSDPGPYAGTGAPKLHDPPLRSPLPDAELSSALAQGAGKHVPPPAEQFDAAGRPKITA